MRLDNAITVFLSEWPAEGAARSTVAAYRANLDWLCTFAAGRGAVHLDDLTPSLLRAAVLARMDPYSKQPRAANFKGGEAAAALVVAAARCLARWLLAQKVPVADLSSVKAPRVPERIQPRLYQEEFVALETAVLRRLISGSRNVPRLAVTRDLALLHVMGETGLRANEICGMQLGDVDLERGEILIRGKGNKQRVLSIMGPPDEVDAPRVLRLLEDWLRARQGLRRAQQHASVWTSVKGNPLTPDELRHVLARMCLEAGLAANRPPHSFRRYTFTEHYRARPNALPRLSARMGWSTKSHKMVDVYTRGVELELAREPLPLLSRSLKVPITSNGRWPITSSGAGPPSGQSERSRRGLPLAESRERDRLPNPQTRASTS